MQGNNVICVVGRTGSDPEMKYIDSNKAVASFNVAVNRPTKDAQGNYITDWFTCEFWGKQAELAGEYIKKGGLVSVVGSGKFDSWEKEGQKHNRFIIVGSTFQLLSPKGENSGGVNLRGQSQTRSAGKQTTMDDFDDMDGSDLPPF